MILGDLEFLDMGQLLGEGADLQVFAARHKQTGENLVVKRPHPVLISRGEFSHVERRLQTIVDMKNDADNILPFVTKMTGVYRGPVAESCFGDRYESDYSVLIEERAKGIPLIGGVADAVRRRPVYLPHNLFAIHPVMPGASGQRFSIIRDLVATAQKACQLGFVALDMRPQNVFFDPIASTVKVIDIGGFEPERQATRRHAAIDMHDFFAELFKFYLSPSAPPSDGETYLAAAIEDGATNFGKDTRNMLDEYRATQIDHGPVAGQILEKISARAFRDFDEFAFEISEYVDLLERAYHESSRIEGILGAWRSAESRLRDDYWQKYLFSPNIPNDGG